ncbi:MAG: hypothetical protein DDT34_02152 [Firmicutes bacterium]|nr:hypothetical protein [Bacillota bacterium]
MDRKSRVERLREIVGSINRGENFSAFYLAVIHDVSINAIYRDVATLRVEGLIPKDWRFSRREYLSSRGCLDESVGVSEAAE